MAWKFDNPWEGNAGSTSENPWDITGKEAKKLFDSNNIDKLNGIIDNEFIESDLITWAYYKAIDDTLLYLPSGNIGTERIKNTEGKMIRFTLGSLTYEAKYDTENNAFLGYYEGENKYENPEIIYSPTTYGHGTIDARATYIDINGIFVEFIVNNLRADDIAVIQIFITPGTYPTAFENEPIPTIPNATVGMVKNLVLNPPPPKNSKHEKIFDVNGQNNSLYVIGGYRFIVSDKQYEGIVDGGPYSTMGLSGSPMYPDKPYINILSIFNDMDINELKKWKKGNNDLSSGFLHHEDGPTFQNITEELKFITLLVGRNYMKSGKDCILYSIKWGYNKVVNKPPTFIDATHNDLTKEDIVLISDIINHDFPNSNYAFFGY